MLKLLTCDQGHFWEIPEPSGNGEATNPAIFRCPVCGSLADELPLIDLPPSERAHEVAVSPPAVPKSPALLDAKGEPSISGYEILKALGKNKKGVLLFRAKQVLINRFVLLKVVLSKDDVGQMAWGALRGEANTLAKLAHTNIPQIHEVGERDRQTFYNVVELVDDEPLSEKLQGKPVPPLEAAKFVESVARVLHFAHEQGVVLRCLQPANILIDATDGQPLDRCPFKIDGFGLAGRPVEGDINDVELQGKLPHYLSPEQAWGYAKDIGSTSDVYALGVLLYEMLVGRPPFRGERASEIIEQIRSRPPTPPRDLNHRISTDLDAICRKCLQKPPRKRYGSALALAEDLHRFQEGLPIKAHDNGLGTRFFKWVGRRPAVACILLLLFLMFLSTLIAYAIGVSRSEADTFLMRKAEERERSMRNELEQAKTETARAKERELLAIYYHDITRADAAFKEDRKRDAFAILNLCPANLRGWEWYYLMNNRGADVPKPFTPTVEPPARQAPLVCVAFSPDGRLLAVGMGDRSLGTDPTKDVRGVVFVYDTTTGQMRFKFADFVGRINDFAFRPDNRSLAVVSADQSGDKGQLNVYNIQSGKALIQRTYQARASSIAYSPDGRTFAIGGGDGTPWLLDSSNASSIQFTDPNFVLGGRKRLLVAFSADGQRLTTCDLDNSDASVWNVATGQIVITTQTQRWIETPLSLSPDGRLATVSTVRPDGKVSIWDEQLLTGNGRMARAWPLLGTAGNVKRVLFSQDGKRLVTQEIGTNGNPLLRWHDGISMREILALPGLASEVSALALTKDGLRLAVASPTDVKIYGAVAP